MDIKIKEIKKFIMSIAVLIILVILDNFFQVASIYEYLNFNETLVYWLKKILFSAGVIDVLFLLKEVAEIIFNKLLYHEWLVIKENISSKVESCLEMEQLESLNFTAVDIIHNIIYAYPDKSMKYSQELCHAFKKKYEQNEMKDEISYFFIENANLEGVKSFLSNEECFFKSCKRHSKEIQDDFKQIDFSSKDAFKTEEECKKLVLYLLHISLKEDIFDNDTSVAVRAFFSWFNEKLRNGYEGLKDYQISVLLQTISKMDMCITKQKENDKNGDSKQFAKDFKKIKKSYKTKKLINTKCNQICKFSINDKIYKITIDNFARDTGVVTSYFYKVSFLNRVKLSLCLCYQNIIFTHRFHNVSRDFALCLLLGAEMLIVSINPDTRFDEKMVNLVFSVANLFV